MKVTVLVSSQMEAPSDPVDAKAYWGKRFDNALEALNACSTYFYENQILLPEDDCIEMHEFLTIIWDAYHNFDRGETCTISLYGKSATSLKSKLANRFRQILGMLPPPAEGPDGLLERPEKDIEEREVESP